MSDKGDGPDSATRGPSDKDPIAAAISGHIKVQTAKIEAAKPEQTVEDSDSYQTVKTTPVLQPTKQYTKYMRATRNPTAQSSKMDVLKLTVPSLYRQVNAYLERPKQVDEYSIPRGDRATMGAMYFEADQPFEVTPITKDTEDHRNEILFKVTFLPRVENSFRFADLPVEIQVMIHRIMLVSDNPIEIGTSIPRVHHDLTGKHFRVRQVSKKMCNDTANIVYGENDFVFASTTALKSFVERYGWRHGKLALRLKNVTISKWVQKTADTAASMLCFSRRLQIMEIADPEAGSLSVMAKMATSLHGATGPGDKLKLQDVINKITFGHCDQCHDGEKAKATFRRLECGCRKDMSSRVKRRLLVALLKDLTRPGNKSLVKSITAGLNKDFGWAAKKAKIESEVEAEMLKESAAAAAKVEAEGH